MSTNRLAIKVKEFFAEELGVDWEEHNKLITKLDGLTLEK